MVICKNGHQNEMGGCCCPAHGNTCGFCPEYNQAKPPKGFSTLAEYLVNQPLPKAEGVGSLEELAASSPTWEKRLWERVGNASTFEAMNKIADEFGNEVVNSWMFDTETEFIQLHGKEKNSEVKRLVANLV